MEALASFRSMASILKAGLWHSPECHLSDPPSWHFPSGCSAGSAWTASAEVCPPRPGCSPHAWVSIPDCPCQSSFPRLPPAWLASPRSPWPAEVSFQCQLAHPWLFGYRYNQLPRLIEYTPQWLPGPSPLLPVTAGPLADYQTGFKLCSDALQLLFNYWHRLT